MSVTRMTSTWFAAGMLGALTAGSPVLADDTELFVGDPSLHGDTKPNVLFVFDTSGSMATPVVTQTNYDPDVVYPGACAAARVYWRDGTGSPPACDTDRWFYKDQLMCLQAAEALQDTTGRYTSRMAQFDASSDNRWERISRSRKDRPIECEDDSGAHGGFGFDAAAVYARNGVPGEPWSDNPNDELNWGQNPADRTYTLYGANYLNWYYGPATGIQTRSEIMKQVATDLLSTVEGVNVGLMRFNNHEGGPVIHAMEDIVAARPTLETRINNLPASGWTPLSETLFEAGMYYSGGPVDYGNLASPESSVTESRSPSDHNRYQSPVKFGCQKNFVVLLTDSAPTEDVSANAKIQSLPGFAATVGPSCDGSGDGACLDDMAQWMHETDLSPLPGQQNVITYTIGFAVDLPILKSTAERGGGAYYAAGDTATLNEALTNIIAQILDAQTTFTSPTVAVNSFKRTTTLNDVFITLFQPTGQTHWPGNLKKYRLKDGVISDADGDPAVDPVTGFFADGARSYWAASDDGKNVLVGGAANQLPDASARKLYTYLGNPVLSDPTNQVKASNLAIDDALLGVGNAGDPTREDLINFARGLDVTDRNQNGNLAETRQSMGDPLHSKPVSVSYGPTLDDALIFFATNDGYLHAIDPDTGVEQWAFVPPEFLGDLTELYYNESRADKHYGIDGNMTIQTNADLDGIIDAGAGESVYLYFGLRRGGTFYYALDVTNPGQPQFMWRLDAGDLPGVGQTWSNPVATRVKVADATQNADQLVLLFGGGYDTSQDNYGTSTDATGNAIYMVDSISGQLLWHASHADADRNLSRMTYSIPGDLKVLDMNGDKRADRVYAADMGGQVWRLDIRNGEPSSTLVNGGVFAQLGAAGQGEAPATQATRRFYYAPDAALVSNHENSFLHIGIGSGHRARPLSTATQDRFYALRDYDVFSTKTQAEYDALQPIQDDDLVDVTNDVDAAVPLGAPGWRLELRQGGWLGEKVLAQARTFDNRVFFTTFTPGGTMSAEGCVPGPGTNRLYAVDLLSGAPVTNLDGSDDGSPLDESDRSVEIKGSISSEVVFMFPAANDPDGCTGDECTPNPAACVGLFCFDPEFDNRPVRTFWSQEATQ